MEKIILSTGDIKEDYEVIDVILHSKPIYSNETEVDAFRNLKEHLRKWTKMNGGDAIIHCRFEFLAEEVRGYGTVVKIKK